MHDMHYKIITNLFNTDDYIASFPYLFAVVLQATIFIVLTCGLAIKIFISPVDIPNFY